MNLNNPKQYSNLKSPIFWKICAGIFISILLIETLLLLYSWFAERDRQIERVNETIEHSVAGVDQNNVSFQLGRLLESNSDESMYLLGYLYKADNGKVVAGGNVTEIELLVNSSRPVFFDGSNGELFRYINRQSTGDQIWVRIDASRIVTYMRNYIWRILGMISLISLFVTVGCLLFLKPLLINPLQRLDQLLVRGKKLGIGESVPEARDLARKDELGNVFQSFDTLRNRLIESEALRVNMAGRFEQFANMGADCFFELDRHLRFTYVAGDVMRVLSLTIDEVNGKTYKSVVRVLGKRLVNANTLQHSLHTSGIWTGSVIPADQNQSPIFVRIAVSKTASPNGEFAGFRGTITDVSKETALAEKLQYQATHDELTGLANRRELTHQMATAVTNYLNKAVDFSILIIDLDRFKTINDSCGHTAGDMLLKSLSDRLVATAGKEDTVARTGGDEFAILLRSANTEKSKDMAERVRVMIEEYRFHWNGQTHRFSASIGVAQASADLATQEALVFAADACCLKAKRSGKNQIQIFSQQDAAVSQFRDEAKWISRIMQALESDGFTLFRQSIVPVGNDKKEDHFEILIRMNDSDGGFWPPQNFLGAAERNDLMPKIDEWVVNNAIDWLAKKTIPDDTYYCMNINLSGASLSDSNFRNYLLKRVRQSQHLNRYICFEITETAAMVNFDETIALLNQLKEQGCQVALDDFGTGFSSLSHIKDLPLDYIKIDGVFIKNIVDNLLDQTVVSSVSDIANVLNIKTVAEFIDSECKLKMIESMSIDYAQGYLFSKPEELSKYGDDVDFVKAA